MAEVELIMPKMGESITEATILKWLKNEGDKVELDEAVLEIATDKVDSEVPSPFAGTLSKILYKVGDVIAVNKPIAIISTDAAAAKSAAPVSAPTVTPQIFSASTKTDAVSKTASVSVATANVPATNGHSDGARFYSPLVLNIARSEGISMSELEAMAGTGLENRVTKKDILNYVTARKSGGAIQTVTVQSTTIPAPEPTYQQPQVSTSGNVEIIEMDRMRKLIADHMVMSKRVSAHVTSFVEADVTNLVLWRERVKKDFEKREGEKITFTPLFIEAIVKAIKDFPLVNSSLNGTQIIRKKDINIGMAAALPSGNLIVPVIKNADTKNLIGITKEVNDLANRARKGQLKPNEIEGGTFTVTNVGTFGNLMGTPIINQPQVAIMATGAIKKKPVVLETPQGDVIAIRHMMFLSLSYDHRIVDGALGGSFLRKVADYLEQYDLNRAY
ncbi:dihydrolipoamide acetyltransferase component of pyruvate dehydrogenase complex [Bacteroidota bacterium]|nr:dihydrolipoamide acetyltransferase component of pyruvate dehydrogenase complex [Bacteroidota bacterium]